MTIIERIKAYCRKEQISQGEFAKRTQIHPVTLSRLMNKRVRKNVLFKLDEFLDAYESKDNCQQTKTAEV